MTLLQQAVLQHQTYHPACWPKTYPPPLRTALQGATASNACGPTLCNGWRSVAHYQNTYPTTSLNSPIRRMCP